ncbi:MAG TPA: tRNA 2-selenouridine(34) synthase MnmH [Pseudomonadales bacterium]
MTADARLKALLAARGPFIDLRAPAEFAAGAVPGAVNLPLLTDQERHQIGRTYKTDGQAAAVAVGERLVSGEIREARITAWMQFLAGHPRTWLYCWRGGMRSEIVQQWLAERGVQAPRVPGGFKALRHCCLEVIEAAPGALPWFVLGGRTGTGKTDLLTRLPGHIDLEGLARHRGSAFGGRPEGQPPPVAFENALAVAWLNHQSNILILEDESRTIGRLAVPPAWHTAMQQAPLVILETEMPARLANISREYVWEPLAAGMAAATLEARLAQALNRIRRRLGGQRHAEVAALLARGFENGDHDVWIARLLDWYYDPMYDYQLEAKLDRVVFRGDPAAVANFLLAADATAFSDRDRDRDRDRAVGPQTG